MKLNSISDVIQQMEALDGELAQSELSNVKAFNHTYLIITESVFQKLGTGLFQHEDVMQRVDVAFFEYYSTPLKKYKKDEKVPLSWKILFDLARDDTSFQFLYMALGVNAHVNNDLSQALLAAKTPEAFKSDYDKVNEIIYQSLREVVACLKENSKLLSVMEKNMFPAYAPLLNIIIRRWRENAWQNFLLLKEGKKTIVEIEKEAGIIAQKLVEIRGPQHFYKLKNFF